MLEKEILLIGIGDSKKKLNEVFETNDISKIQDLYGEDSCFVKAALIMRAGGIDKYNILNLDSWENLLECKDILVDYSFDYVVPLEMMIDEKYFDEYYGKELCYGQLLTLLLNNTISTIVFTGKHASVYEDMDSFLKEENARLNRCMHRFSNLVKENIIYVANNLSNVAYANIAIATMLVNTDYDEYPVVPTIYGPAVFDIYYSDVETKLVYFRNNHLTGTTVENLVNFSTNKVSGLVPVHRIIKYFFYHKPAHEQFIGKAFTEYRKMRIQEELIIFLESLKNWIIYDYEIDGITAVSSETGSVDVILRYDIWPKFTTEKYTLEVSL